MMQEWADTVDAWVEGRKQVPTLLPTGMPPIALDPAFDRAGYALGDVWMLCAMDRLRAPRQQPCLDLGEIPDDAARGQREAAWKIAALLHLVDDSDARAVPIVLAAPPPGLQHVGDTMSAACTIDESNIEEAGKAPLLYRKEASG